MTDYKYRFRIERAVNYDAEVLVLNRYNVEAQTSELFTVNGWAPVLHPFEEFPVCELPMVNGIEHFDEARVAAMLDDFEKRMVAAVEGETFADEFHRLWLEALDRRGTRELVVGP